MSSACTGEGDSREGRGEQRLVSMPNHILALSVERRHSGGEDEEDENEGGESQHDERRREGTERAVMSMQKVRDVV